VRNGWAIIMKETQRRKIMVTSSFWGELLKGGGGSTSLSTAGSTRQIFRGDVNGFSSTSYKCTSLLYYKLFGFFTKINFSKSVHGFGYLTKRCVK
jgi:hypothetical protein